MLDANDLVEVIVPGNGFCFPSTLLVGLGEHVELTKIWITFQLKWWMK